MYSFGSFRKEKRKENIIVLMLLGKAWQIKRFFMVTYVVARMTNSFSEHINTGKKTNSMNFSCLLKKFVILTTTLFAIKDVRFALLSQRTFAGHQNPKKRHD